MEIRCPHCRTRYRLDPATFPRRRLRLRCADCGLVFSAASTSDADAEAAAVWAGRLARTLVQDLVRRSGGVPRGGRELEEFKAALARRRRAYEERAGASAALAAVFDAAAKAILDAARDD